MWIQHIHSSAEHFDFHCLAIFRLPLITYYKVIVKFYHATVLLVVMQAHRFFLLVLFFSCIVMDET